jgi:dienelactone hydrolase
MKKFLFASIAGAFALSACSAEPDVVNVERFQPPIVNQSVPVQQHSWSIPDSVRAAKVSGFSAIIPSYNGKGNLIASWNPRGGRVADRPTFIIVHGGHGLAPTNFVMADWMIRELDANVLLLDSYWSRGQNENWRTWNEMGVNMRLLDAVAAARFTRSQGADPKKTFLIGDSQGGWTVLRTFTAGHSLEQEVKSLYQGGLAMYPNCYAKEGWFGAAPNGSTDREFAPPLGPYSMPVVVFTASKDEATPTWRCNEDKSLKSAYAWHHYEGATHAWDAPFGGIGNRNQPDGVCTKADNIHNRFPICRSNKYTEHMRQQVLSFVQKHSPITVASAPTTVIVSPVAKTQQSLLEQQGEAILLQMEMPQ